MMRRWVLSRSARFADVAVYAESRAMMETYRRSQTFPGRPEPAEVRWGDDLTFRLHVDPDVRLVEATLEADLAPLPVCGTGALAEALRQGEETTAHWAAVALGRLGGPEALAVLVAALAPGSDDYVREAVIRALELAPDTRAVLPLEQLARNADEPPALRMLARAAAATLRGRLGYH